MKNIQFRGKCMSDGEWVYGLPLAIDSHWAIAQDAFEQEDGHSGLIGGDWYFVNHIELVKDDWIVELPCKIGDTVYFFDQFEDEIYEEKVDEITIIGKNHFVIANMNWKLEDFGKTIFLSRDAAENALMEG